MPDASTQTDFTIMNEREVRRELIYFKKKNKRSLAEIKKHIIEKDDLKRKVDDYKLLLRERLQCMVRGMQCLSVAIEEMDYYD